MDPDHPLTSLKYLSFSYLDSLPIYSGPPDRDRRIQIIPFHIYIIHPLAKWDQTLTSRQFVPAAAAALTFCLGILPDPLLTQRASSFEHPSIPSSISSSSQPVTSPESSSRQPGRAPVSFSPPRVVSLFGSSNPLSSLCSTGRHGCNSLTPPRPRLLCSGRHRWNAPPQSHSRAPRRSSLLTPSAPEMPFLCWPPSRAAPSSSTPTHASGGLLLVVA